MVLSMKRYGFLNPLERLVLNRVNENGRKALQVLVSVVLGALILAGLYLILNATVLPNIKQRITDMFNYKG